MLNLNSGMVPVAGIAYRVYCRYIYARALKSRTSSVNLVHFDVVSRCHAHTSISHALALFRKITTCMTTVLAVRSAYNCTIPSFTLHRRINYTWFLIN